MASPIKRFLTAAGGALLLAALVQAPAAAQDFDAVLAAPDDPEVNLTYARAAAAAGDLSGAAAALERVLILDPDRHGARLFYAIVLYRLDDLQRAREQLALLDGVALPPLQRAEADEYRRKIDRGREPLRFGAVLTSGWVYEEDAAGALLTTFDSVLTPPVSEEGLSSTISARGFVFRDLGENTGLTAYGLGGLSDKATVDGPDGDFRRIDVEGGLSYRGRLDAWSLGLIARRLDIFDAHYMDEVGVRGRASWRLSPALSLGLGAEAASQAFDEPTVDAIAGLIGGDRDGWRYDVSGDVTWRFSARSSLGLIVGWTDKQADYEPFGYSGPRLQGVIGTSLRAGQYVSLSGGIQKLDYDAPDPVFLGFGTPTREDTRTWGRLAVGAPMSAFNPVGATADWRQNVTVEGAVTYGARDSGPPLSDFDSWGAELRLAWRFGARD